MFFFFEATLLAYCLYFVFYALFFSISALFYKTSKFTSNGQYQNRFAVLIPGYKEDIVILEAVKKNLDQTYPDDKFDLFVIADSFEQETLAGLSKLPVVVNQVSFENSTKVKSLRQAVSLLPEDYDFVIVLDADNVMERDFLEKVNAYILGTDAAAIQTQRWPQNENNRMAVLDGVSEAINNHIYRQGAHASGFSASLAGSGMVFQRGLFQKHIESMDSIGGFDRELEFRLLEEEGVKVAYYRDAKVLDQKTDNHGNFNNQRTRWISSQYVYLFRYFGKGIKALFKGDLVYFQSTIWRNIQLPRLINLGLITILAILSFVISDRLYSPYWVWPSLWLINTVAIFTAIPRSLYTKKLFTSILLLPKLFLSMSSIMFRLKGANKKFIHTEHKAIRN